MSQLSFEELEGFFKYLKNSLQNKKIDFCPFYLTLQKSPKLLFTALGKLLEEDKRLVTQLLIFILEDKCNLLSVDKSKVKNRIKLLSASPRRKLLLSKVFKGDIYTDSVDIDEYDVSSVGPSISVMNMSLQKVIYGILAGKQDWVNKISITSDTIVSKSSGKRLGKVGDSEDPTEILFDLQGEEIIVNTGFVLIDSFNCEVYIEYDSAYIKFHSINYILSPQENDFLFKLTTLTDYAYLLKYDWISNSKISVRQIIEAYVEQKKYQGKAGGFGMQDRELFICIKSIKGDPFTVVGLPLFTIKKTLKDSDDIEIKDELFNMFWPSRLELLKISKITN